jgi:hypothetical protein
MPLSPHRHAALVSAALALLVPGAGLVAAPPADASTTVRVSATLTNRSGNAMTMFAPRPDYKGTRMLFTPVDDTPPGGPARQDALGYRATAEWTAEAKAGNRGIGFSALAEIPAVGNRMRSTVHLTVVFKHEGRWLLDASCRVTSVWPGGTTSERDYACVPRNPPVLTATRGVRYDGVVRPKQR